MNEKYPRVDNFCQNFSETYRDRIRKISFG